MFFAAKFGVVALLAGASAVSAASLPKSSRSLRPRWADEHEEDKCGWASITICNNIDLLYDPYTGHCYNPAAHPSDFNCAYLQLAYNSVTEECDASPASAAANCNAQCLIFNPKTAKCFNPARHPSYDNCAIFAQFYDPASNTCTGSNPSPSSPSPSYPNLPTCPAGQNPSVDAWGKPTGGCSSCGPCYIYQNMGIPACGPPAEAGGQCTCSAICPEGQTLTKKWGLPYCG